MTVVGQVGKVDLLEKVGVEGFEMGGEGLFCRSE
jgi:hypothetical protein